jgi:hypothetical protein
MINPPAFTQNYVLAQAQMSHGPHHAIHTQQEKNYRPVHRPLKIHFVKGPHQQQ